MGMTPALPDGEEIPARVDEWTFDPDVYNGIAWLDESRETSVVVFEHIGTVQVKVIDERAGGFLNGVELYRDEDVDDRAAAVLEGLEVAVAWMRAHEPREWAHPDVDEAVFDAPDGYELDAYYLEARETIVLYRRVDVDELERPRRPDAEWLRAEMPYLWIRTWNGSGNSDVEVAPWPRSHEHERVALCDRIEGRGLAVAVARAKEFAGGTSSEQGGQAVLSHY